MKCAEVHGSIPNMPTTKTPFDITSLNDAEIDLLLGLAARPNGAHELSGCRRKVIYMILRYVGIDTTTGGWPHFFATAPKIID